MTTLNIVGMEFGWSLTLGLVGAQMLRGCGERVHLITRMALQEPMLSAVADEYALAARHTDYGGMKTAKEIHAYLREHYSPEHVRPLPTPPALPLMPEPYVCVIPTVADEKHDIGDWRNWQSRIHSLSLSDWQRIYRHFRERGYYVVAYTDGNRCPVNLLPHFSDVQINVPPAGLNYAFWDQLQAVKAAHMTVATAGAALLLLACDLPGVGMDGALGNTLGFMTPDLLEARRTSFAVITRQDKLLHAAGVAREDCAGISRFLTDLILRRLDEF